MLFRSAGGTDVILFVVECDVPLNASETAALRSFDPEGMKTEEIVRQCLRAMVMR